MEASREFSRTPRRLPPCSDVSVLQKTRMSHFWDTHHMVRVLTPYGACPKHETCAFSEGLTHHCTGAGGVGYEKVLDWPPWKEPLPTRAWLTTPSYPPVGPVLWTSQIAPIFEPVFFRFLGLKVCNAKAHVLTGASMRGVPNRVFFTGGYTGVFFTFSLVRLCPFLCAQIVSACLL